VVDRVAAAAVEAESAPQTAETAVEVVVEKVVETAEVAVEKAEMDCIQLVIGWQETALLVNM
jgi:hypothetical protein